MGTSFIATQESRASAAYKQMLLEAKEGPSPTYLPIVYTDRIRSI
jgi:nitronate monooxygenase